MANNILTKRVTVAASQTNATLVDPGAGKRLVIDLLHVTSAGATSANKLTIQLGDAGDATVLLTAQATIPSEFIDYRCPTRGNGIRGDAAQILKASTGTGVTLDVTVGYHLDSN